MISLKNIKAMVYTDISHC